MSLAADSTPPGELYCTTCEKTFKVGDKCPTDGTRLLKLKARIDPFLGRDLDGRYTVLEKLGQGGMGAVYRAEQHSVDREVAIKVVNSSLVSEPEVIKRFLREAKLASRLSHPNAVAVLDFGQTDDGVFYLVMELVTGRTLDDVIKADRAFRPERVVRIGTQVCDALEGAHALSIIHRDLKPSNIMLMASGRDLVKVLDFGLAKSVSPDATSTTMTNAGSVVGTPAFMPPELARGEPCDARSDLYSLGVILYLLGCGRLPFESESLHELLAMHGSDDPAPPMVGVPPRLAAVIDRMLRKNPNERYDSAAAARTALEDALANPHVPADDTNPSIGPFPATSSQFKHLDGASQLAAPRLPTSPPRSGRQRTRTPTEMAALISADTMLPTSAHPVTPATSAVLAAATTPLPMAETPAQMPTVRRARWPVVAAIGAVIAGVVMFVALRGGTKPTETPIAPATSTVATPATTATPATSTAPPATAPPATAPPATAPPATAPPATAPPASTPALATVKRPKTKPPAAKPPITKPPITTTATPATTSNPPSVPAHAGSAAKPALPF